MTKCNAIGGDARDEVRSQNAVDPEDSFEISADL
jgi:hypothetical protein